MLNYSAIIQAFIKKYKRHTKYIFSFLCLSLFVVLVVGWRLTKPAISMTTELSDDSDQINNINSAYMINDSDEIIPTIDINYSESVFKDYMSESSTLLGEATRFHLFAFNDITINSHCNGNFATPDITLYSDFGTNQIANAGGDEVSVITDQINGNITSRDRILLIPSSYSVTMPDGSQPEQNSFSTVMINNTAADFPDGNTSLYRITSNFIDFAAEKTKYITLSEDISNYPDTDNVTFDNSDTNDAIITAANENDNEINVINLTATQLTELHNTLKIITNGEKPLIINVDLNGCSSLYEQNFKTVLVLNGNTLINSELNIQYGTNVLWNYYDSSSADKSYTGTIKFRKETSFGCILSPCALVQTDQNIDGNIIADSIYIGSESHKMMFMTSCDIQIGETINSTYQTASYNSIIPNGAVWAGNSTNLINVTVRKFWSDGNDNHSGDQIKVKMYKAPNGTDINSLNDSQMLSQETTFNNGALHWECTWYSIQIEDGQAIYVKETESSVASTVTYQNNGLTQSGEITITNTINGSGSQQGQPSSDKVRITVRKQWSGCDSTPNNAIFEVYRSYTLSTESIPNDASTVCWYQRLAADNSWTLTETDLPAVENGQQCYYYVKEIAVDDQQAKLSDYDISYSAYGMCSAENTVTITNTKKGANTFSLEVHKNWEGISSYTKDITVSLQRSTDNANWTDVQNCTLNSSGGWRHTFNSIPKKYNDSTPYYYRATEVNVPSGYTDTYSVQSIDASGVNGSAIIEITNTLKTSSLTVKKFWENIDHQAVSDDINDIKVSVYKHAVDPQSAPLPKSMPKFNRLSLDGSLSMNVYSSMNGNTLTLDGRSFGPKHYAFSDYEIYYDLGAYAGSTVKKVEVTLSTTSQIDGCIRGGKIESYGSIEPDSNIPLFVMYQDSVSHNGNTFTYEENGSYHFGNERFSNWTIYSNSALVITHTPNTAPNYSVQSVKLTFGNVSYNPGVTTTVTTAVTTPVITTSAPAVTTVPVTTTTKAATTTAAPLPTLQQPGNRTLPGGCELCTVVTLNSSNNWQNTLNNLPLADDKGNIYEYYIVETMIDPKDGSKHNYMIKSYSRDSGLLLSENAAENVLSVSNTPYTTSVMMPSTGGITPDIYYKTGLIMLITSGGIYIALNIIKKRKT